MLLVLRIERIFYALIKVKKGHKKDRCWKKYGVPEHVKKRWATNNTSTIGTPIDHIDTLILTPTTIVPQNAGVKVVTPASNVHGQNAPQSPIMPPLTHE